MNPKDYYASNASIQTAADLRQLWISYFLSKGHHYIESASLVPSNDPSLLFTTAGMQPFKEYFSGHSTAPWKRVVSIQKCLRTTDLDCVGKTERHCSFFEMLGNFSFGDYFKEDAISYAWEFSLEYLRFAKESIHVSVYHEDEEAFRIWKDKIGVPEERIWKLGKADNWWGPVGEVGPCGPCSELYLDRGKHYCESCACSDKSKCAPGAEEGERYMEYWNLVFNEFYQDKDPHNTSQGILSPLDSPGVDTGAGLERILALLHDYPSVYECHELKQLARAFKKQQSYAGSRASEPEAGKQEIQALRVACDHLRAVVFSIADAAFPSNTGRGYVVRRLIRRALVYTRMLGLTKSPLSSLVSELVELYSGRYKLGEVPIELYPELKQQRLQIEETLATEEQRFLETLDLGLAKYTEFLEKHYKAQHSTRAQSFSGEDAFMLYDSYGFPLELTAELLGKKGISIDMSAFNKEMELQKRRSSQAANWKGLSLPRLNLDPSIFIGYDKTEVQTEVLGILQALPEAPSHYFSISSIDEQHSEGQLALILKETPFYAEAGGQVGDSGWIQVLDSGNAPTPLRFRVRTTQKLGEWILHLGYLAKDKAQEVPLCLSQGVKVQASIDIEHRQQVTVHHSATHLLNQALREVLGSHIHQTGSLVAEDKLRFDFSHPKKLSDAELRKITVLVNQAIGANAMVRIEEVSLQEAQKGGALATFGEKYGDRVRVVAMYSGEIPGQEARLYSKELCGGCHVKQTSELNVFCIVKENSPGAGNRRIEAVAGKALGHYLDESLTQLKADVRAYETEIQDFFKRPHDSERAARWALQNSLPSAEECEASLKSPDAFWSLEERLQKIQVELDANRKKKAKLSKQKKLLSKEELAFLSQKIFQAKKILSLEPKSLLATRYQAFNLFSLALPDQNMATLKQLTDYVHSKEDAAIVLLGSYRTDASGAKEAGSSALFFSMSPGICETRPVKKGETLPGQSLDMSALLQVAAEKIGGRGGGRPERAQAGGVLASKEALSEALRVAEVMLCKQASIQVAI